MLLLTAGVAQAEGPSLCDQNEAIVFACSFSNKKSVSLCKGKMGKTDFLEYRYGRRSEVEMRFRAYDNETKKFHRAEVIYASNASDVMWFQRRDVFYLIHLLMRGGPILNVVRAGRTISHQNCEQGWKGTQSNLALAEKFLLDHGSGSVGEMAALWGEK